jgi:intracellular septation protein A
MLEGAIQMIGRDRVRGSSPAIWCVVSVSATNLPDCRWLQLQFTKVVEFFLCALLNWRVTQIIMRVVKN